jgi:hypothetical protein
VIPVFDVISLLLITFSVNGWLAFVPYRVRSSSPRRDEVALSKLSSRVDSFKKEEVLWYLADTKLASLLL